MHTLPHLISAIRHCHCRGLLGTSALLAAASPSLQWLYMCILLLLAHDLQLNGKTHPCCLGLH